MLIKPKVCMASPLRTKSTDFVRTAENLSIFCSGEESRKGEIIYQLWNPSANSELVAGEGFEPSTFGL